MSWFWKRKPVGPTMAEMLSDNNKYGGSSPADTVTIFMQSVIDCETNPQMKAILQSIYNDAKPR